MGVYLTVASGAQKVARALQKRGCRQKGLAQPVMIGCTDSRNFLSAGASAGRGGLNVSLRSSANRGAEREPSSTLLATLQADAHTCETGSVQPFVVPSSAGRWATHGTEESRALLSGCG